MITALQNWWHNLVGTDKVNVDTLRIQSADTITAKRGKIGAVRKKVLNRLLSRCDSASKAGDFSITCSLCESEIEIHKLPISVMEFMEPIIDELNTRRGISASCWSAAYGYRVRMEWIPNDDKTD